VIDPGLARRIRLVGLDVDGVLTDGGLYLAGVAGQAVEFKRFDSRDGTAVWLLRRAGLTVVISSGRHADATAIRARELKVDEVLQDETGGGRKVEAFERMLARRGLEFGDCAFVGDDLADLPLLRRVGLPIAVANAVPEAKAAAALVTRTPGGHGAVREIAEALLRARGVWDDVVTHYLEERGDAAHRPVGSH
jgi:3-deoxy-D-manno-octulosonate 8-phosphate phosphatase (KDO 8-P phosphatase)